MRMNLIRALALAAISGTPAALADNAVIQPLTADEIRALEFVPGEIMVGFHAVPTQAQIDALNAALGGVIVDARTMRHASAPRNDPNGVHPLAKVRVFTLAEGADVADASVAARELPGVEYAHPNFITRTAHNPNDPMFPQQYGPQIINAPLAWDTIQGSNSVVLAVADTGLNFNHEEFPFSSLWVNPGEIPGNGIDDDGNGYIDDIHGWDFIGGNNNMQDGNGHGTHVAGIAAARMDNSKGIAGIAQVKIMVLQVFSAGGWGTWEAITEAIYYATDNGAHVLNYSGGGGGGTGALATSVTYAWNNGMPVIAAAGNNNSSSPFYPAAYPEAIAISGTDRNDNRYNWSNHGNWIDVAAPAVDVLAPWIPGASAYTELTGTSMAAPHVAGLVALMYSINPDLTPQEVRDLLRDNAVDLGAPGFDTQFGWGRIDAAATVAAVPVPCPADLNGDGQVDGADFFMYLDWFAAGDARADLNGDGELDGTDFFMYLDLFAQGCD